MAELSREENVTYVIKRTHLSSTGQSQRAINYSPTSAYATYLKWVGKYGTDNVSIELERTVKTYETISPEELAIAKSQLSSWPFLSASPKCFTLPSIDVSTSLHKFRYSIRLCW